MRPVRDLTDAAQNAHVLERAARLLAEHGDRIDMVDDEAVATAELTIRADPLELEALRCARSRRILERAVAAGGPDGRPDTGRTAGRRADDPPIQMSVVWAMYGETGRIRAAGPDHPHGEDFLRVKVSQMSWLTDGLPIEWELVAVDDGCPDEPDSATVATDIATAEGWTAHGPDDRARVRVLRLADVVGERSSAAPAVLDGALAGLASTADSRKGGAILYGLADAVDRGVSGAADARHVVLYTDADLSANLAQAGLLAGPIIDGRVGAVAGQRYGVDGAVLVKPEGPSVEPSSTGGKPDKMIILFRHFVRAALISPLSHVLDTQAGFKAFSADALRPVLSQMRSFDETFDVELLIRFVQRASQSPGREAGLAVAPIVFVEDFAQTNFPSIDPGQRHLDMIHQLVAVYDGLVAPVAPAVGEAAELLDFCRNLDLDRYVALIERLRADDEARSAAGVPDPLFASYWALDRLTARS